MNQFDMEMNKQKLMFTIQGRVDLPYPAVALATTDGSQLSAHGM